MREYLHVEKTANLDADGIRSKRPSQPKHWLSIGRVLGFLALMAIGILTFLLIGANNRQSLGSAAVSTAASSKDGTQPKTESSVTNVSGQKNIVVPVVTATAQLENLPLEIHNIGNVEAYSVVNVIAQVGGQLTDVHFTQGQDVRKGDLLFKIDPRSYQAQLAQAEANVNRDQSQVAAATANLRKDMAAQKQAEAALKRDQATQKYADVEVNRYGSLVQEGAVSKEQADQVKTTSDTAGATVMADAAAIDNAKAVVSSDQAAVQTANATWQADKAAAENLRVQLGYTEIRSPINGRTGSLNVYQGNVVRANDTTPLVTINQIQPIYVTFSVPESHLAEVRTANSKGTLKVTARLNGDKREPQSGQLTFIDNTVDKTTGTIRLRATFPNQTEVLWPGQFVDVVLNLPGSVPQVVVPSQAVQSDQAGQSVYVVQPDNTVKSVVVEVQRNHGDSSVIKKGLKPGDVVVIDGQMKLAPGMKIKQVQATPLSATDSSDESATIQQ